MVQRTHHKRVDNTAANRDTLQFHLTRQVLRERGEIIPRVIFVLVVTVLEVVRKMKSEIGSPVVLFTQRRGVSPRTFADVSRTSWRFKAIAVVAILSFSSSLI